MQALMLYRYSTTLKQTITTSCSLQFPTELKASLSGDQGTDEHFAPQIILLPGRDSRWMSYEDSKIWVSLSKYLPQILMVCMYIGRKWVLQTKIFKISYVGFNKSVRAFFSASNYFLHLFCYMYLHFLNDEIKYLS